MVSGAAVSTRSSDAPAMMKVSYGVANSAPMPLFAYEPV